MLPLLLFAPARARAQGAATVYKDPTCGCCSSWVALLRKSGLMVSVTDAKDISAVKDKYRIPQALRSCHTALIDGYVIEGHVPPADIKQLLKDRAAVAGLAVPGMPIGSPGMEVSGVAPQAYDVIAFTKDGKSRAFASYRQGARTPA